MAGEQPVVIKVEDYDEDTGVMTFDTDEAGKEKLIKLGMTYVLMLALLDIDEEDVFGILQEHKSKQDLKENLEQSYEYWHEGSPV